MGSGGSKGENEELWTSGKLKTEQFDESRFCLFVNDASRHVHQRPHEAFQEDCVHSAKLEKAQCCISLF